KEARTFYQEKKKDEYKTFVHVQLETGRTHQIRVHFSHLGHPLLGDTLYGGKQHEIGRQALHCNKIRFTHPFTNEALYFTVPIPRDMQVVLSDFQNKYRPETSIQRFQVAILLIYICTTQLEYVISNPV